MQLPTRLRFLLLALLCLIKIALPFSIAGGAEPTALLKGFERSQLIVTSSKQRCILFDIYIAQTRQQRSQGLMFIRSLEQHEGMLFTYSEAAEISMWMKNTFIPLDMLFFDANFEIFSIHRNATPHSTEIISSKGEASGVVELKGGSATYFGIQPGDRIIYPRAVAMR